MCADDITLYILTRDEIKKRASKICFFWGDYLHGGILNNYFVNEDGSLTIIVDYANNMQMIRTFPKEVLTEKDENLRSYLENLKKEKAVQTKVKIAKK